MVYSPQRLRGTKTFISFKEEDSVYLCLSGEIFPYVSAHKLSYYMHIFAQMCRKCAFFS